ncbi:hypothetical protein WL1483_4116 [Aeromonas schubertii]|uniref:Uncharacterized protein n=1 Tax=Aeromonas schubertii TaxID=652 RepID=A0A0S2SP48_9GAMM|nr:hypothetical protein WL1483_4116 [Aeromonas schubertii]
MAVMLDKPDPEHKGLMTAQALYYRFLDIQTYLLM